MVVCSEGKREEAVIWHGVRRQAVGRAGGQAGGQVADQVSASRHEAKEKKRGAHIGELNGTWQYDSVQLSCLSGCHKGEACLEIAGDSTWLMHHLWEPTDGGTVEQKLLALEH